MSFAKINQPLSPIDNFWKLNPWLTIVAPFSTLYNEDTSENKMESSKKMIAVFLLTEVDEDSNPFARMDFNYRKELIEKDYCSTEGLDEYINAYLLHIRTLAERTLYEELDTLVTRGKIIRETPITLDTVTEEIEPLSGKKYALKIQGTASQLESMRKNTAAIYKAYEEAKKVFDKQKLGNKVFGQGKLTNSDRGAI